MSDLLDELKADKRERELRDALNKALYDLARAKAKTEDLIDAVYRAVGHALTAEPVRPVPRPALDRRRGKAEHALWHLTDWQGSKVTPSYNSEVMRRRISEYTDTVTRITEIQRAEHPVTDATILFGGDMVEGLFNFPTQVFEIDATIFAQWVSVSRLLTETVQAALATYQHVTVVAEWGNHGRIGSKRDAVPRSDNLDRMCYETARQSLAHDPRLTWEDCPEDIQRVEIGNYRALSLHGDETGRNGFVSQTTFLAYVNRLKAGAYPWPFRDVYTGHYHTHEERSLPDGTGSWYQTGSTESDNRYARNGLGSAAQPSQRLHFIDPDRGRVTAQYKIHLATE